MHQPARTWAAGDPEPVDRPPVVDGQGSAWRHDPGTGAWSCPGTGITGIPWTYLAAAWPPLTEHHHREDDTVPRRFFYDTEFIEDGRTIDLVSIGIVADDGREYYRISTDFDPAKASAWVRENVLAKLPSREEAPELWAPKAQIAAEVLAFLDPTEDHEDTHLWAWFSAYDHVALAWLWGPMCDMPDGLPYFTRDLRQLWEDVGKPERPAEPENAHEAIADARWNARLFEVCQWARHPQRYTLGALSASGQRCPLPDGPGTHVLPVFIPAAELADQPHPTTGGAL